MIVWQSKYTLKTTEMHTLKIVNFMLHELCLNVKKYIIEV